MPVRRAVTSSPSDVSPDSSQKNAPPRPLLLAQAVFVAIVAGVS